MKAAFSTLSREIAREMRSISARLWYLVGVMGVEVDVAMEVYLVPFRAVEPVSGGTRWE